MKPGSSSGLPVAGAWRFIFVMDGSVTVTEEKQGAEGAATTYTAHELSHGGGRSVVQPTNVPLPPLVNSFRSRFASKKEARFFYDKNQRSGGG